MVKRLQMLGKFLFIAAFLVNALLSSAQPATKTCHLRPLGVGHDDTAQVEVAISECGHFGTTVFEPGSYNITRKMTWDLVSSRVELNGFLSFVPDVQYWLNPNSTYRVIFIQSQASWFVITGRDFVIDAGNTGGIQGNGQPWWSYFATHTRADGDGRPVSLSVVNATNGTIKNFRIESPPFWSNAVSQSSDITYDGMFVNATNTDPLYVGKNIVPNTDGINTYRSDRVSLHNWDVTCGDDCLAIKGNSTNIDVHNVICRGGNGIAFGSLGQYVQLVDNVLNVTIDQLQMIRLDPNVQPNMVNGVYFKSWTGTSNGSPPTGGGGGLGTVQNVHISNVVLDRVNAPVHLYQTNNAHSGDAPSKLRFGDLHFVNWSGTATTNKIVDIECSPAAPCSDITFEDFRVSPPTDQAPRFICQNTSGVTGLSAPCNATGNP